ncbi:amidohydrolase family protein [Nocardioides sp. GXZ039]|uniref:amidohydrolase family protein n=1 Tax=Nocardioides sp. GXZ039 TaxID=3136018 RepID=UPI0030F4224A
MPTAEFNAENAAGGAASTPSPLPDDVFVIDAVTHAYNLSEANARNKYGLQLGELIAGIHATWNPPELTMEPEVFRGDTSIETVMRTMFEESQTDVAVHHVLRLDSWFHDGLCARDKTEEALRRWPHRVIGYVGVDPLAGPDVYLPDLREQVEAMPSAVGLKLYPHGVDPYRRWRADDPEILELFAAAQELGLKSVAIHKAVPNGAVPMDPYKVDDIDIAADAFPDMTFEIVHSGMAFLDETAWAIGRYPNVYANLEITTSLLQHAPGWFEEILAQLIFWGGPQKVLWATGCILTHPQALLERFWALEFSEATLHKFGIPQLTEDDKRAILGLNYAGLVGFDIETARAQHRHDEFALARSVDGLKPPFSTWRETVAQEAAAR